MTTRFKARRQFGYGGTVYLRDQTYNADDRLAKQVRQWHAAGLVSLPGEDDMPERAGTLTVTIQLMTGTSLGSPNRRITVPPKIRAELDPDGLVDDETLKVTLVPALWTKDELRVAFEHAIVAAETRR